MRAILYCEWNKKMDYNWDVNFIILGFQIILLQQFGLEIKGIKEFLYY